MIFRCYCWCFRNPHSQLPGMYKTLVNNGRFQLPTSTVAGFLPSTVASMYDIGIPTTCTINLTDKNDPVSRISEPKNRGFFGTLLRPCFCSHRPEAVKRWLCQQLFCWRITPWKFNSLPLKMDGWKMRPSFWDSLFSGAMLNFGGVWHQLCKSKSWYHH